MRAAAYRMFGSLTEAEDTVQETWLRLSRQDTSIENLGRWLTTVPGRVFLDMLPSGKLRREDSLDAHVQDPILRRDNRTDPERDALIADSVGLALLVVFGR